MHTIDLRHSYLAHLASIVTSLLWLVALYLSAQWLAGKNAEIAATSTVMSTDFMVLLYWPAYIMCWIGIAISLIVLVHSLVYGPQTKTTLVKNASGVFESLNTVSTGFLWTKKLNSIRFEQVHVVEVSQATLDVRLNTGSLHLKLVTRENGFRKEVDHWICNIESPFVVKSDIESGALPRHLRLVGAA